MRVVRGGVPPDITMKDKGKRLWRKAVVFPVPIAP